MGLHPSLKIDSASSQQRSVLTRIERIKDLMRKGLWSDARQVTGLPKTKIVKVKTRKAAKATEEAKEGAAAEPSAGAAAQPAKEAKAAKA